eukprot:CAMPEP_0116559892 /NCGR_PEP_ID=MMETSP0397-20121206/10665_1 /TAXON_ID=216820 /ORGANISM="Cyclophora tenuis, Strain ECT3854" /LENGTH=226 /DNA_ID=CAMNT_0004085745 /DNA_START=357 /DNA_END=1037 /DNA_ORIENTATION=+
MIRKRAHEMARALERGHTPNDTATAAAGDHCHATQRKERTSYRNTLRNVYKKYSTYSPAGSRAELSVQERHDLEYWVRVSPSRRGLERMVMKKAQNRRRSDVIRTVLSMQQQCRDEGLTQDQTIQLIKAALEPVSSTSAKMAAVMGAADAVAASFTEEETHDENNNSTTTPTTTANNTLQLLRNLYANKNTHKEELKEEQTSHTASFHYSSPPPLEPTQYCLNAAA